MKTPVKMLAFAVVATAIVGCSDDKKGGLVISGGGKGDKAAAQNNNTNDQVPMLSQGNIQEAKDSQAATAEAGTPEAGASDAAVPEVKASDRAFEVYELIRNAGFEAFKASILAGDDQGIALQKGNEAAQAMIQSLVEAHPEAVIQALYVIGDEDALNAIYGGDSQKEYAVISGILSDENKTMAELNAMVLVALDSAKQESEARIAAIDAEVVALNTNIETSLSTIATLITTGEIQTVEQGAEGEAVPSVADQIVAENANIEAWNQQISALNAEKTQHQLRLQEVAFFGRRAEDSLNFMWTRFEQVEADVAAMTPAETPAETPVEETPVETPAETPVETPTEEPSTETPASTEE